MLRLDPDTDPPPFSRDRRRRLSAFALLLATAPFASASEQQPGWPYGDGFSLAPLGVPGEQSRSQSISLTVDVNQAQMQQEAVVRVPEGPVEDASARMAMIWLAASSVDTLRNILASPSYHGDFDRFAEETVSSLAFNMLISDGSPDALARLQNILSLLLSEDESLAPQHTRAALLHDLLASPDLDLYAEDFDVCGPGFMDLVEQVKRRAVETGGPVGLSVLRRVLEELEWIQEDSDRLLLVRAQELAGDARGPELLSREMIVLCLQSGTIIFYMPVSLPPM